MNEAHIHISVNSVTNYVLNLGRSNSYESKILIYGTGRMQSI